MKVYKFTVTYAGLSDCINEEIVVRGASSLVEAFKKSLDQLSRPDVRYIRLFDYYDE